VSRPEARRDAAELQHASPRRVAFSSGDPEATSPHHDCLQTPPAATRRERNAIHLRVLRELFPESFGQPRPLRVGIHHDIVALGLLTPAEVRGVLVVHCNGPAYLQSLTEGANRIDLNGEVTGQVSREEAEHATAKLAVKLAAREARRSKATPKPAPAPVPAPAKPTRPVITLGGKWKAKPA